MTVLEVAVLLVAAVGAGAVNAVAGGGSFLTLPALILFNVPPVAANATAAVATWPGLASGAWGYRHPPLRATAHLVTRATQLQALTPTEVGEHLELPLSPDRALIVPLHPGRKHLAPTAVWGRVTIEDAHLSWAAADVDRLHFFVITVTMLSAVGVAAVALYFIVKYRRRSDHDTTPWIEPTALHEAIFVGVPLGLALGMVVGLIYFDNIGLGLALGPALGVAAAIGVHESRTSKRTGTRH